MVLLRSILVQRGEKLDVRNLERRLFYHHIDRYEKFKQRYQSIRLIGFVWYTITREKYHTRYDAILVLSSTD